MRLVPKLALALFTGVFVVIAGFGGWQVHEELEVYDHEVRKNHRIIGTTAAAALARWRTLQEAQRLGQRVNASREDVRIRFVSLGPKPPSDAVPAVTVPLDEVPAAGAHRQLLRRFEAAQGGLEPGEYLLTYVGAPIEDEPFGAIELAESMAPRSAYLKRWMWSTLGTGAAMLLVCTLIVAWIGANLVGKPVAELIKATRLIASGNFDVLPAADRQDEFGELARALRRMSLELEDAQQRTRAETEARIKALEQLRHADRLATLGKMASVLAHEIGTPLNVIAGHAKLVRKNKMGSGDVHESAVAIGAQCERMTSIVRRILDYARRRAPRKAWIDAADVMAQARELLSALAKQRGVTLELVSSEPAQVFADPGQLQQALTNLILNALQASSPGSVVRLSVEAAGGAARIGDHDVRFVVEDAGGGIPGELRERIFEPFFTTKPAGDGTGLGLSVVRDIAEEHGGVVEVWSEPGVGSRFTLRISRDSEPCQRAS